MRFVSLSIVSFFFYVPTKFVVNLLIQYLGNIVEMAHAQNITDIKKKREKERKKEKNQLATTVQNKIMYIERMFNKSWIKFDTVTVVQTQRTGFATVFGASLVAYSAAPDVCDTVSL